MENVENARISLPGLPEQSTTDWMKFIFSQFWRPEVQNQGVSWVGLF